METQVDRKERDSEPSGSVKGEPTSPSALPPETQSPPPEGEEDKDQLDGEEEEDEQNLNIQTAPAWEGEDITRRLPTQNERVIFLQYSELRRHTEEQLRAAMGTPFSSEGDAIGSPRFTLDLEPNDC